MATNICPTCGQPLKRSGMGRRLWSAYGSYRQSRITTYSNMAMTPWQPQAPGGGGSEPGRYLEAERRSPYRPQNAESDFLVPALQALATGAFVTIGAGWAAWMYKGFTWEMAVGAGLFSMGGFWVITVLANRKLLWMIETITNGDLDQDGVVGEPAPAKPVALEITHRNEAGVFSQMFRFELPEGISEADLAEFARGVVQERRGLAESAWTGAGKPFSRARYADLLATLQQAGLVRWKNENAPAQGRELTPAGGRAFRVWLEMARTHARAPNGGDGYAYIEEIG